MMTIVSNNKLRKFMGTDDLHQFKEAVLINNIKAIMSFFVFKINHLLNIIIVFKK